jgi:dihydrofolate reductase
MRTLIYHVAVSADGFIARENGSFEDFVPTGDHADEYLAALRSYETIIMGRKTYDVGLDAGVSDPYPFLETIVFSRTLGKSPNARVKVLASDPAAAVRELKQRDGGPICLCGGGELASVLFEANVVDELILKVNPMLLGSGIPLARGLPSHPKLTLASTKVHANGVIVARYAVQH